MSQPYDSIAMTEPARNSSDSAAHKVERRSFLRGLGVAGATAFAANASLPAEAGAQQAGQMISKGDAALLRFAAAAEIIESDIWLQYQELAGQQDDEVAILASKAIPGYPAKATGGNPKYTADLQQLDSDMPQYIHDNTEDELTHEMFLNTYLAFNGAPIINLDKFRTLPSSQATGSNKTFGRLTNLTRLTVDTTWWTRYRSGNKNPDLGDTFPQAIPTLAAGQHTAIPRTDADASSKDFLQAIANTAGFHFAWIEQGGTSLYPKFSQRASSLEVLRILLSIGGT